MPPAIDRPFVESFSSPLQQTSSNFNILAREYLARITPPSAGSELVEDTKNLEIVSVLNPWIPEFGAAAKLVRSGELAAGLSQFYLGLISIGVRKRFKQLLPGRHLFIFKEIFFEASGELDLASDGDNAKISAEECNLTVDLTGNCARVVNASGRVVHPLDRVIISGKPISIYGFDAGARNRNSLPWPSFNDLHISEDDFLEDLAEIRIILSHLERDDPDYARWVANGIRVLVVPKYGPVNPKKGMFGSCSYSDWPGYVQLGLGDVSTERRPWWLGAADLIHEASHQYFMALSHCFPVGKRTADLRYSALAGKLRPVDKVLTAFHASVNMTLFHEKAGRNLKGAAEICPGIEDTNQCTASLYSEIHNVTDFTEVGAWLQNALINLTPRRLKVGSRTF